VAACSAAAAAAAGGAACAAATPAGALAGAMAAAATGAASGGGGCGATAAACSLVGLRPFGLAVFPAMHSGLFPVPLRLLAPVQLLVCAFAAPGAWGLSCAVRGEADVVAAARGACARAAEARDVLMLLADGGAGLIVGAAHGASGACVDAPMEYMVALAFALSAGLTVGRVWPDTRAAPLSGWASAWVSNLRAALHTPRVFLQPPALTLLPSPPPRSCFSMSGS
jgi:hypothetical protein